MDLFRRTEFCIRSWYHFFACGKGLAVGEQVGERVLKEMNYLAREQEEQAEERYRRLDEAIRQHHKSKKLFHKKSKDKAVLPKTTQLT